MLKLTLPIKKNFSLFLAYLHVVEILLTLDIIYLTWEYGLINSFSSWKTISRWALSYHG